MLFGGVDRAEAHLFRDLGARRRIAGDFGQLAHEAQDLCLPLGQGFHELALYTVLEEPVLERARGLLDERRVVVLGWLTRMLTGRAAMRSAG